jgi:hypothetical protein
MATVKIDASGYVVEWCSEKNFPPGARDKFHPGYRDPCGLKFLAGPTQSKLTLSHIRNSLEVLVVLWSD